MPPPLLALAAAMCFSISQVTIRLGTRKVPPVIGLVLTLLSGVVVTGVIAAVRGFGRPSAPALLFFALAGLLGPGGARFLSIASVARIGATRTVPIVAASHPTLSVMLGIVLLSESLTGTKATGIALTIAGILLVVRSGHQSAHVADQAARRRGRFTVLALPATAGAFYGFSDLARKSGMQAMANPLTGSFIGLLVAALIWLGVTLQRGRFTLVGGEVRALDIGWFLISGVASSAASIFLFWALIDGELSIVAPIVSLQPILVAVLAGVFLRRVERLSPLVAFAAMLATVGAVLIAMSAPP